MKKGTGRYAWHHHNCCWECRRPKVYGDLCDAHCVDPATLLKPEEVIPDSMFVAGLAVSGHHRDFDTYRKEPYANRGR